MAKTLRTLFPKINADYLATLEEDESLRTESRPRKTGSTRKSSTTPRASGTRKKRRS